jgi:hypothetical protein
VEQLAALGEQRAAPAAADRQHGAGDGRRLLRPESPARDPRHLGLEEGRGVLHGLRDPARYGLVDDGAPVAVTDERQEAMDAALGVAGFVAFGEGSQRASEGRASGRHEEHRFEEHERRDPGRVPGRELQGDRSTQGVPNHVRSIRSDMVEEPDSVLGLHGHAGRPRLDRAGAPPSPRRW